MRSAAYWLTVAFVFTVPWEAAIDVGGVGRLSKVVGLCAGAVWVVSVVGRGRLRQPDAFHKAFLLFVIWNGLTFYWSIDSGATVSGFLTYLQIFAMLLILWDLCDTVWAIENVLQAYVLGAFVSSGAIIIDFVTHPPSKYPEHRFPALGFQIDAIALIVALAAPAAWYLAANPGRRSSWVWRSVNYSYVPIGAFALVLTGTRGATVASIPTAIFVLWSLRRSSPTTQITAVGALAAAAVAIIWFAPNEPVQRISTVTTATDLENQGALSGRWAIWGDSRRAFLERPVTGAGLGAHRAALASLVVGVSGDAAERRQSILRQRVDPGRAAAVVTGREAHNAYLSVLVEAGLVGFLLLIRVLLIVLARIRQHSGWESWYWSTQLAVLAIGAMSLSIEQRKDVWIFLSLAVASAAVVRSPHTAFAARRTPLRTPRAVGATSIQSTR